MKSTLLKKAVKAKSAAWLSLMPLIARANDAEEIFSGVQEKGNNLVDPITTTVIVFFGLAWLGVGTAFLFNKIPAKWMASLTAGSFIIMAASAIVNFLFS